MFWARYKPYKRERTCEQTHLLELGSQQAQNINSNAQISSQNVLQFLKKYTKIKVLRISEKQHNTLVKMKSRNVDVSNFIRQAIKEKIEKDYADLKPKEEKPYCPF